VLKAPGDVEVGSHAPNSRHRTPAGSKGVDCPLEKIGVGSESGVSL